jgi:hypothetical protein
LIDKVDIDFFETVLFCVGSMSHHFRRFFPFTSELFTLFFERVHDTRPRVPHFPARPMSYAHLCMWGKLLSNRGQSELSCTPVDREVCDFLDGENNLVLNLLQYSYLRTDQRGCPNILFTTTKPLYERYNIIIMF